ncbi:MAG: tRNA preQ1(34) S-adenosylmethionine ribosyltransferase-isomerase QueA [Deltaproteobacteria bacterium]|nr:tRNA preQ1(34) S-adenosylmethionine ribosyltransferase-isomerase QueA [Deltaproteobacteria bacterium]
MRLDDFDYYLPPEHIASHPPEERDAARLLILDRSGSGFKFGVFRDLLDQLRPQSVLVLNDTRVIPARLDGRKLTGGKIELLLVRPLPDQDASKAPGTPGFREVWEVMAKGLGSKAEGSRIDLGPDFSATVLLPGTQGSYKVALESQVFASALDAAAAYGRVPLPPYIEAQRRRAFEERGLPAPRNTATEDDLERYQTVVARVPGAVAAPTAGLHFTPELLDEVRRRGHEVVTVTLHVGPGTFRPVQVEDPLLHRMDVEHYDIPAATHAAIVKAKAEGRPIVAVGTTVVRTLEGAAALGFAPGPGSTDIFIKPGDTFSIVTDLVTNFHLPKSTLLMLVAAFAGHAHVMAAYKAAIEANFRFYSYGDAMFISPWAQPQIQNKSDNHP